MQEFGNSVLELSNREVLKLTGVQNVDVFEDEKITLRTEQGALEIQGVNLNITRLDLETGVLQIDGAIDAIIYAQEKQKRKAKKQVKQSFVQKMLS